MGVVITKQNFEFLKELANNNNREWFEANRNNYDIARENTVKFAEGLLNAITEVDNIATVSGKKSLYRIYRDVRFSKNKSPYKTHWAGGFSRATAMLRGGYYFHLEPGNSFLAGGFFGPNSADLKHLRDQISADPTPLRDVLASPSFVKLFGGVLRGEIVKTSPRGFEKDDPSLDLLRFKQFIAKRHFTDKEVLGADFLEQTILTFKGLLPYFGVMTEYLVTDLNGELLN